MAVANLVSLFNAYGAAKRATAEAIANLRKALPESREDGRVLLLPVVAKCYNVPLVTSTAKANAGALVLDSTHEKYDAARFALRTCLQDVYGFTKPESHRVEKYRAPNGLKDAMASVLSSFTKDQIKAYLKHLK